MQSKSSGRRALNLALRSPLSVAMLILSAAAIAFIPVQQYFLPDLGDAGVVGFFRVLPIVGIVIFFDILHSLDIAARETEVIKYAAKKAADRALRDNAESL